MSDERNYHQYTVPAGTTLVPDETLELNTGSASAVDTDVTPTWDQGGAVWNNSGDRVTVTTDGGTLVLKYAYE